MRFEFQTSFWEQYVGSLTILLRVPSLVAVMAVIPLIAVLVLWSNINSGSFGFGSIAFVVWAVGFAPLLTAVSVWLARRRNKTVVGSYVFEIDEQGIRVSGAVFEMKLAWAGIPRVVETKRFFFFFISSQRAHYLPKRVITTDQQLAELRRLVSSRASQ